MKELMFWALGIVTGLMVYHLFLGSISPVFLRELGKVEGQVQIMQEFCPSVVEKSGLVKK